MSRVEEIAMRVFRIDKVIYFHDGEMHTTPPHG